MRHVQTALNIFDSPEVKSLNTCIGLMYVPICRNVLGNLGRKNEYPLISSYSVPYCVFYTKYDDCHCSLGAGDLAGP